MAGDSAYVGIATGSDAKVDVRELAKGDPASQTGVVTVERQVVELGDGTADAIVYWLEAVWRELRCVRRALSEANRKEVNFDPSETPETK